MNYTNDDRKNIGNLYTEMYNPKNNANLIKEAYEEDGEKVREFRTYGSWKSAVKKLDPSASFTGDRDIDSYKGKKFFAEWDGEKGEIRTKIVKEASFYNDEEDDDAEFYDDTSDYDEPAESVGSVPAEFENKTADRPFPHLLKTYEGDRLKNVDVIWLNKSDIADPHSDDVPFTLGSNQSLTPIND